MRDDERQYRPDTGGRIEGGRKHRSPVQAANGGLRLWIESPALGNRCLAMPRVCRDLCAKYRQESLEKSGYLASPEIKDRKYAAWPAIPGLADICGPSWRSPGVALRSSCVSTRIATRQKSLKLKSDCHEDIESMQRPWASMSATSSPRAMAAQQSIHAGLHRGSSYEPLASIAKRNIVITKIV